ARQLRLRHAGGDRDARCHLGLARPRWHRCHLHRLAAHARALWRLCVAVGLGAARHRQQGRPAGGPALDRATSRAPPMTPILRDSPRRLPLIAILRGMKPDEAPWVLETLSVAGFQILEVPLNSPRRFESLAYLVRHAPAGTLIGAGTVLTESEVDEVAATGA